jgi:hypothetical protein
MYFKKSQGAAFFVQNSRLRGRWGMEPTTSPSPVDSLSLHLSLNSCLYCSFIAQLLEQSKYKLNI